MADAVELNQKLRPANSIPASRFGISRPPTRECFTVRCDIHRAILDFHSSDSDGAVKPDHGGVLTPRLSEVVVEKIRSVAPSLSSVK